MSKDFPIVLLKNLPFDASSEDLYGLTSKFGSVLQIRRGSEPHLKGNCFVVYFSLEQSKKAVEGLNGFSFKGRYLVALSYSVSASDIEKAKEAIGGENERLFGELVG